MATQANPSNDPSKQPEEDDKPDSTAEQPVEDQETEVTDDSHVDDDETDDDGDEDDPDGDEPDGDDEDDPDSGKDDPKDNPDAQRRAKAREDYKARQERKANKSLEDRLEDLRRSGDPNDADHRIKLLEARDFVREVRANQQTLESDNERVEKDFPIFNPESDEYNEKAANAALGKFARMYIQRDPGTGEVLGAYDPHTGRPVSLYQFMQQEADVFSEVANSGALRGQQAEMRMRSRADGPGSTVPKTDPKTDPDLDGWGDEGY